MGCDTIEWIDSLTTEVSYRTPAAVTENCWWGKLLPPPSRGKSVESVKETPRRETDKGKLEFF